MIEIKGKYNEAKIFTDVVDSASIAQVQELCNQEFTAGSRIRLMPDIHAGKGCTIGTTMTIIDRAVPNLVGVDIGCGMETTRIREGRLELQKLDKLIYEKIPSGFSIRDKAHRYLNEIDLSELCCARHVDLLRAEKSIGTLGGGNHFIEVDKDDEGNLYIVVHSGSRHLGVEVASYYLDFIDCFEADSTAALQKVCAPFTQPEDYSWCIHVREQMVERYGTAEQLEEYRHQLELRGTPEHIPKRSKGVCLMNIQKTAPTPKLVTMIPADPQMTERDLRKKHLRVAPYCRVSTDKEEQLSSYEAQIEYYTEKIDANPDWTMVRLYADEGITGTSAKKRKDFLQMIRDCERGKIDLVITKSVSRFCRNTLDGLNYVRRLKRHGVGVYFEKENVNTLFMDNEMILTFMMSQAQAESESLSGNVRWGHRKNFKDGKVYYHCKTFLGYRWGADGQPEIDPEQAAIVRRIFSRFLLGHSVRQITTDLMADGIKTATGKTVWHDSVVQKMLCNEKYIGDALLQKTYIADLFTREKRVNNGELPKYYVHDCHPAIIDRETFQKVQEEIARRSSLKKTSSKAKTQLGKYCGKYVLSELLVCGECGSPYRRVIWTQKGVKRVVWRCQNRLEHGRKICKQSPTLDEGNIHDAVISAMNELFRMQAAKDAVKAGIAAVLAGEEQTMSLPAVEFQIRNLQERQLELFQLIVSAGADCTDYDEELQQVNMAKTRLMAQKAELEKEQRGAAAFESRLAELDMALEQASGTLTDFDELTVRQLVSNIKVLDKDSLLICFKDGTEITQAMQRRQTA